MILRKHIQEGYHHHAINEGKFKKGIRLDVEVLVKEADKASYSENKQHINYILDSRIAPFARIPTSKGIARHQYAIGYC